MGWDAQKMLDQFILDYMIKREMHAAAATFAKQANVSPEPAGLQSKEGFLREWWGIFSNVYAVTTEAGSSSSAVSTDGFRPNDSQNAGNDQSLGNLMKPPRPNKFPRLQKNSPSQPQSALPTTALMQSSGVVDYQGGALPEAIPRPEFPGAMEGSSAECPIVVQDSIPDDWHTTQSTEGNQSQNDQMGVSRQDIVSIIEQPRALPTAELVPSSDMVNSQERALPTTIPRPNHPVAVEGSSFPDNSQATDHLQNTIVQSALPTAVLMPTSDVVDSLESTPATVVPSPVHMMNLPHNVIPTATQSTEGNQSQDDQMGSLWEDIISIIENDSPDNQPQSALPTSDVVDSLESTPATMVLHPDHMMNLPRNVIPTATQSTEGNQSQDDQLGIPWEDILPMLDNDSPDDQPQSALPTTELIPSSDMVNSQETALPTTIPSPNHPLAVEGSSFLDNFPDTDYLQDTILQSALPTAELMPTSEVVDSLQSTPATMVPSRDHMMNLPQNVLPKATQIPDLNLSNPGSPSFLDESDKGDI